MILVYCCRTAAGILIGSVQRLVDGSLLLDARTCGIDAVSVVPVAFKSGAWLLPASLSDAAIGGARG
jgi:hypothetical protein